MYQIEKIPIRVKNLKNTKLYSVWYDEHAKEICDQEYIVRTHNKNGIYLIAVFDFTYGNKNAIGKRFCKKINLGFLDPIPNWCRTRILNVEDLDKNGYFKTKLKAYKHIELPEFEDPKIELKIKRIIQNRIKRLKEKVR